MRALVVDDTALFRRVVTDVLSKLPDLEVVGTASNGKIALRRIEELRPDLVTLDMEMPEMGGLAVLEALRTANVRPAVVVLSSHTISGGDLTMRALELGAFDFVTKPEGVAASDGVTVLRCSLGGVVEAARRQRFKKRPVNGPAPVPVAMPVRPQGPPSTPRLTRRGKPLVVIGVSTGGPPALARLLPELRADFPAPIFIVQHMPALFTKSMATSLAAKCRVKVYEATDGTHAMPGNVYIAPGGKQMKLIRDQNGDAMIRITDDPPENSCKPAVDYMFRSAAINFPGQSIALVMTGMGSDGTSGLKMLKRGGCVSIAQDEATSVVFGMPKAAIESGMVDVVAPLDGLAGLLTKCVQESV